MLGVGVIREGVLNINFLSFVCIICLLELGRKWRKKGNWRFVVLRRFDFVFWSFMGRFCVNY